jgi:predicted membrane protein
MFEVEVGAAELSVTGLGNARCARISVTGGVGQVELDFTGSWLPASATDVEVTIGLGTLTLRFPEGLGVAIDVDRFLASFEDRGFARRGSRYVSAGFDEAGARIEMHLKAVFGDVNVEWVPASR